MDVARRQKILGSETMSGAPKTTARSNDSQGGIPRLSITFVLTALIYYSEKRQQRERLKEFSTKEIRLKWPGVLSPWSHGTLLIPSATNCDSTCEMLPARVGHESLPSRVSMGLIM